MKDIYGLAGYNGNGARLAGYEFTCRDGHEGILLHFSGAEDGFYRKKRTAKVLQVRRSW